MSSQEIFRLAYCIFTGMSHMHAKHIALGDCKPDNILIKDGVYYLADYSGAVRTNKAGKPLRDEKRKSLWLPDRTNYYFDRYHDATAEVDLLKNDVYAGIITILQASLEPPYLQKLRKAIMSFIKKVKSKQGNKVNKQAFEDRNEKIKKLIQTIEDHTLRDLLLQLFKERDIKKALKLECFNEAKHYYDDFQNKFWKKERKYKHLSKVFPYNAPLKLITRRRVQNIVYRGNQIITHLQLNPDNICLAEMIAWKKKAIALLKKDSKKACLLDEIKNMIHFCLNTVNEKIDDDDAKHKVAIYETLCDKLNQLIINKHAVITHLSISKEKRISIADIFMPISTSKKNDFFIKIANHSPLLLRELLNHETFRKQVAPHGLSQCLKDYLSALALKEKSTNNEVSSALIVFRIFQKYLSNEMSEQIKNDVLNIAKKYVSAMGIKNKKITQKLKEFLSGNTTTLSYRVLQAGSFKQWVKQTNKPNLLNDLFNFFKEPTFTSTQLPITKLTCSINT